MKEDKIEKGVRVFMDIDKLLTEKQVCRMLGISRVTAFRLRRERKLAHYKIGSKVLYKPEHVEQFLAAHEKEVLADVGK